MYWTYLRRELAGRKKQTIIVAVGLAVAIALVIVVNALSAGVRDAQAQALESVYGVGTDLTVTGAAAEPGEGGGQRFEFDSEAGETTDGTTSVSQSRLTADFMRGTLDALRGGRWRTRCYLQCDTKTDWEMCVAAHTHDWGVPLEANPGTTRSKRQLVH